VHGFNDVGAYFYLILSVSTALGPCA
jgi:hypothetical protein